MPWMWYPPREAFLQHLGKLIQNLTPRSIKRALAMGYGVQKFLDYIEK